MEETKTKRPAGMFGFTIVWLGQIISVLASSMSQFGLSIWMYDQTRSALAMGTMQVFFVTPFLLISPIAGVMVDRHNRKLMMMISDLGAGLATLMILVLQTLGVLEYWHLYAASIVYGLGMAFQWPAYSAAISTMVPKEQLGRANGMMSLVEAGPGVVAPLLAGALLPVIGLTGLLFFDVVTFLFAIGALLIVHIPQPIRTEEGQQAQGSLLSEAAYGFKYIFARPSLLGLQLIFFAGNLFTGISFTLLAPMILARTDSNSLLFGTVQTAGAIGAVAGGLIMSAWGGFKRRVHGVLAGWMWSGLSTAILGFTGGLSVWVTGMILVSIISPLINGSNQAIWQSKVAPDLQGRVFSARRLIAWFTNPISPLIAGSLADFVLEPAMRTESILSSTFGRFVGTGPGAGMGLLIIFSGLLASMAGAAGYFFPAIRQAEDLLPDHDAQP
ncbi:MAG: MFS transporter [Anaerolineales bacterium]|nr:MFS transporter [Anaerolineales bacterium]MBP6210516.1 MFS transporter [Anaerolineales bacterium]MBP8164305.1 MFS transporter [Anaerolineales bacterium]